MELVAITPHTNKTCSNCKHWGHGFNASSELEKIRDYNFWTGEEKLNNIKKAFEIYPLRKEDKCQMTQNDVAKTQIHYIGVFFEQTTLHQRPTPSDWYCPLWEKFEASASKIELTMEQWCSIKLSKDKEIYDVTEEGSVMAGNRYNLDTRKKRVKELFTWTYKKYTEEQFDAILKECEIKEKKKGWFS